MKHIAQVISEKLRAYALSALRGVYERQHSPYGPTEAGLAAWVDAQLNPKLPTSRGKDN